MKTISIDELHQATNEWVHQAAHYGEILVTDSGETVAKLVSIARTDSTQAAKNWEPSPAYAAIMKRPLAGTDSTQIVSDDRDSP